jgi:hypothetical protein
MIHDLIKSKSLILIEFVSSTNYSSKHPIPERKKFSIGINKFGALAELSKETGKHWSELNQTWKVTCN